MPGTTGDLANWDVVRAQSGEHVRGLTLRHLLAEAELAETIATPAEYFGELFWRHVFVVIHAHLSGLT